MVIDAGPNHIEGAVAITMGREIRILAKVDIQVFQFC